MKTQIYMLMALIMLLLACAYWPGRETYPPTTKAYFREGDKYVSSLPIGGSSNITITGKYWLFKDKRLLTIEFTGYTINNSTVSSQLTNLNISAACLDTFWANYDEKSKNLELKIWFRPNNLFEEPRYGYDWTEEMRVKQELYEAECTVADIDLRIIFGNKYNIEVTENPKIIANYKAKLVKIQSCKK